MNCGWCRQPLKEFTPEGTTGDTDLTKVCPVCDQDYDLDTMNLGLITVEARHKE